MLGNRCIQLPDIRRRNLHKLRERPVLINPDNAQVLANVGFAHSALVAMPTIDVHFRADKTAWFDGAHVVAHALDVARKIRAPGSPAA